MVQTRRTYPNLAGRSQLKVSARYRVVVKIYRGKNRRGLYLQIFSVFGHDVKNIIFSRPTAQNRGESRSNNPTVETKFPNKRVSVGVCRKFHLFSERLFHGVGSSMEIRRCTDDERATAATEIKMAPYERISCI